MRERPEKDIIIYLYTNICTYIDYILYLPNVTYGIQYYTFRHTHTHTHDYTYLNIHS